MNLNSWAARHRITPEALADLRREFVAPVTDPPAVAGDTEAAAQSKVRLEASRAGARLWRNNVGAYVSESGALVRYGLANDSRAVNDIIKSSDLIGLAPVVIRPEHVGQTFGLFVAREMKAPGWRYRGDKRERAQLRFLELVAGLGGNACFATGPGTI